MLCVSYVTVTASTTGSQNKAVCPTVSDASITSFKIEGQWCAAQQLLVTPEGHVFAELDYVFIRNQRNFVVGGGWFLKTPEDDGKKLVSHTRQGNSTDPSEIIEDILDCNNETILSVEIDNINGISFNKDTSTTFWVYNASSNPPVFLVKLLATQSSAIHANGIVAYGCPEGTTDKDKCGGKGATSHDGLPIIANLTTPWLNIVVQQWTATYAANIPDHLRSVVTVGLLAQIAGLATSPQSLSWCASSIAALCLVPLIVILVACCCCHRERICKRKRGNHYDDITDEAEKQQYETMFAVPSRRVVTTGAPDRSTHSHTVKMTEPLIDSNIGSTE